MPQRLANGQVSVVSVDGAQQSGTLVAWDANSLIISIEDAPETISIDQILEIRWPNNTATKDTNTKQIELVDGTMLPLDTYKVSDSKAQVSTVLSEKNLRIATSAIRRVQFTTLTDQIQQLWTELGDKQLAGDILVVHKKNGTVLDYLTGLLGDISSDQVIFNWERRRNPSEMVESCRLSLLSCKRG